MKELFLKSLLSQIICLGMLLFSFVPLHAEQITVFKDSEIENYIKTVATPLLQVAGYDPQTVNFYVVDNPNLNAFVAGGQNIFIFSGLLTAITTDDELAGVIAHELSHITEGHLLQGEILAKKSHAVILVSLLIGTIITALNPAYLGAVLATLTLGPSISIYNAKLHYSRADEMQADRLAVKLLDKTHYSSYGLISFMEKLQALEDNPNYLMSWYSTHPLTSTRISFLKSYLKDTTVHSTTTSNTLLKVQVKLDAIRLSYKEFTNKYPSDGEVNLYGTAIAAVKDSDYKKAENILVALLKQHPTDVYYLELLADVYYATNQFKQAYNTYTKIINHNYILDLKTAKAAYAVGNAEMVKESLKYVNISLGKNNESPLAWHLKSIIMAKLNYPHLATLAMAQKYYILGETSLANEYAQKAVLGITKTQPEWLEAQDLIQKTS